MKRNILLLICSVFFTLSTFAERKPLPDDATLNAINDSICQEALMLYTFEMNSWCASDSLQKYCQHSDKIDGILTYAKEEQSISTIFFNAEEKKCYFEYNENSAIEVEQNLLNVRDLSEVECSLIGLKYYLLEQIDSLNVVRTLEPDFGSLNIQVIPMSEDLIRVYVLQGTVQSNVIPFGNDYIFDFDGEGNLIQSIKPHSGLIPCEWTDEDKMTETMHSHLKNSPYISVTDICTFLLYGVNLYHLDSFKVYSTAFSKVFRFNASTSSISVEELF